MTSFSRISVKDTSGKNIGVLVDILGIIRRYALRSCVFDLYQFIFTSIDIQVRHRFLADFVCGVYYDSFAKEMCQKKCHFISYKNGQILFVKLW